MRQAVFAAAVVATFAAFAIGAIAHEKEKGGVSIFSIDDDDRGAFVVTSDELDLSAKWRGDFDVSADGRALKRLKGRLEVERVENGKRQRAVFEGDGASLKTIYFVDDRARAVDKSSEAEIGDLVLAFVRASGVDADERVADMLTRGGPDAVLAEIDAIESGHAAMIYIVALAEQGKLTPPHIERIAARVEGFDGDHSKRRALETLFERQSLSAASRARLLKAAEGISGDHDLRLLLETVAAGELTTEAVETALSILSRISGDHDARLGVEALIENAAFKDADAARLIAIAAAQIDGDHDLRLAVEAASARIAQSDAVAAAAIGALAEIESDHDCRLALESVAAAIPRSSPRWRSLVEAVAEIGSDHDARVALEDLADLMPDDASVLAAYRARANAIGSEHDRENALAAVEGR
ncbi:MAG: hypothetical protein WD076_02230 [Parvularculaceae bacterium]